jgi:peptidoglycan hydrolase-like protein with peptidoglycan-binding domain
MFILWRGHSGSAVSALQRALSLHDDGYFGKFTEEALKLYQRANGLSCDGIARADIFLRMGIYELVLLRFGCRGEAVEQLQHSLGILMDGRYGLSTQDRVKQMQSDAGLPTTGAVGPLEIARLELFSLDKETRDCLLSKDYTLWDDLKVGF